MELTKSAEEMIVNAQMLRISANQHKSLCAEHLFYGLLVLSRYLDPPMNKPQYEKEGAAVRDLLTQRVRSIESAAYQLKLDAAKAGVSFADAAPFVGRASEIAENAGKPAIDAVSFAAAILEKPTQAIASLFTVFHTDWAELDAKYPARSTDGQGGIVPPAKSEDARRFQEDVQDAERRAAEEREQEAEKMKKAEQERLAKEKAEKEKAEKEKAEQEKADREAADKEKESADEHRRPPYEPTTTGIVALLAMLAAFEKDSTLKTQHGFHKRTGSKPKRFTKLGLFTYRGGVFAAGLQYFLFGLLIPFGLLFGLDRFTGLISHPATPFVSFLAGSYIVFWMYYILHGVSLLIGLSNLPTRHFLDMTLFCALLFGLARVYSIAYRLYGMPVWLRVTLSVLWVLSLMLGAYMFRYLVGEDDLAKTRIMFKNVEGTPAMIFFRFLTKQLILPVLIFSVFWIFQFSIPSWLGKAFSIWAFLWVWNVIFTMWRCVELRYENTSRNLRGEVFCRFMFREHVLLFPIEMMLFLHWLFGWFPMQAWVIALLGVYGFIWLGLSLYHLLSLLKGEA